MADRPNFFDLLELDPGETRREVIEGRLQEKRARWARDSTMGSQKKRQEAKRNMDLLPVLQGALADPKLWRQETEDALRRRAETRQARQAELAEWLELFKSSGTCGDEQFEKVCQQFESVFSAAQLRSRFVAAGIRVGVAAQSPKPPRQRTDPVIASSIRRNLELLKLASLYDFLGIAANSSVEALRARAEAIYQESQRRGHTDSEATARNDLAGLAKSVFRSEEDKKRYDEHRLLEAVEAIENQIQAAGADRILTRQELDTLVRLASQRGASPEDAREVLEERAAKEGWTVEKTSTGPAPAPRKASPSQGTNGAGGSPSDQDENDGAPPAPGRLIVRPVPGGLRLSWEAVRLSGIRYRVLRKPGSVPWDEGDGDLVVQTNETCADDDAVPPAVPWHYAVFSLRNGLASGAPAHSGPHFLPAPRGAARGAQKADRRKGSAIRRSAAIGLPLLALGAGVLVWDPPPFDRLAGLGGRTAHQVGAHQVGRTSRRGGSTPISPTAQGQNISPQPPAPPLAPSPPPAPSPKPANAEPRIPSAQASPPVLPVSTVAVPRPHPRDPQNNAVASSSAGNNSLPVVLGTSTKLPIKAPVPAPPAAALPTKPEIAVVTLGDALFASPLEAELEQAFRDEGLGVVIGSPAIDSLLRNRGNHPSTSEILSSLRDEGVHAVVIAQVDPVGTRELSFYGRKDLSSTSRVRIQAYLVDGQRAIGSWSDQVEYTAASARSESESAAHNAAPALASSVRSAWESLRGSSRIEP